MVTKQYTYQYNQQLYPQVGIHVVKESFIVYATLHYTQ